MENKYEELRADGRFDTGSLILFQNVGIVPYIIRLLSKSKYSHIGFTYYDKTSDTIFLVESTIADGFVVSPLKKRLQNLNKRSKTFVRTLELSDIERAKFIDDYNTVRVRYRNTKYEHNLWELWKAAIDWNHIRWLITNKENTKTLFCSELVAEMYKQNKLIDPKEPSNEWTPKDFAKLEIPKSRGHLAKKTLIVME